MPTKEWLKKNRARLKKYQAEYYLKNITRLKEYKRGWYQEVRKENDANA